MNGEIVCNSHATVLGHTKIKTTQDETSLHSQENETQESRRPKPNSIAAKDLYSDSGIDAQLLQVEVQRCLHSCHSATAPTVSHGLFHTNNNNNITTPCSLQKRVRNKERRPTLKSAARKNSQNRKVTDYYPIRRSSRKSKTELKCEQKKQIDELITNGIEEGMEVQEIEGKGRAVFATRCFQKGEYVVEYHGDLLQITDAKKKEAEYAQNPATGCYMYYFQYLCKTYCVDATKETGRMGRLINHSKNGNCQTKLHDINGVPHLILVASRNIDEGEELLYDYGDRSKASIAAHPWLKD